MALKKLIAAALSVCIVGGAIPSGQFSPLSSYVEAADTSELSVWDGTEDTSWYEGEYKESEDGKYKMYEISTPAQLAGLSKLVREGNTMQNVLINLTSDITLNDTENFDNWAEEAPENNWIPIGIYPKGSEKATTTRAKFSAFSGVFNGNGHVIRGMYCDHDNRAGLFAYIEGGAVCGVILEDAYVHAENYRKTSWDTLAGGITAECTDAVIAQCDFEGMVSAVGIDDKLHGQHECAAGGIVGKATTKLSDALFFNMITMSFGVFINPALLSNGSGDMIKSTGIYNCINLGKINARQCELGTVQSGGIIGLAHNGLSKNCLDMGSNTSSEGYIGGIIGRTSKFYLDNCYYLGAAKGIGAVDSDGDAVDNAVNYYKAGMQKWDVADSLGSVFQYTNNDIYLMCDTRVPHGPIYEVTTAPETTTETTTTTTTTTKKTTKTSDTTTTTVTTTVPETENVMDERVLGEWIIYKTINPETGEEKTVDTNELVYTFTFTDDFRCLVSYQLKSNGSPATTTECVWTASEKAAGGKDKIVVTQLNNGDTQTIEIRDNELYFHNERVAGGEFFMKKSTASETTLQLGDANGDNIINAVDASKILVYYTKLSTGNVKAAESDFLTCDINGDEMINAVDASLVLAYYASLAQTPDLTLQSFLEGLE